MADSGESRKFQECHQTGKRTVLNIKKLRQNLCVLCVFIALDSDWLQYRLTLDLESLLTAWGKNNSRDCYLLIQNLYELSM